jgi:hypothetical protein
MTQQQELPEGSNATTTGIRLANAQVGPIRTLRVWHNDINSIMLSPGFTRSLPDPNLYHHCGGILILLYVMNMSMSYQEATTNAAIEMNLKLSEKYRIPNPALTRQLLIFEVHCDGTGVSPGLKASVTTILRRFSIKHTHSVLMPIYPNTKFE